jgi:hypothetical protein
MIFAIVSLLSVAIVAYVDAAVADVKYVDKSIVAQDEIVPFVVKYLPLFPVWEGTAIKIAELISACVYVFTEFKLVTVTTSIISLTAAPDARVIVFELEVV